MTTSLKEFYELKNIYKKNKSKKNGNLCINCKRPVGTIFRTESFATKRVFKILCGDETAPCSLMKELTIMNEEDPTEKLRELRDKKTEAENNIFVLKNKNLYGIIDEKSFDSEFEKTKKEYQELNNEIGRVLETLERTGEFSEMLNNLAAAIKTNKEIDDFNMRTNDLIRNVYPIKKEVQKKMKMDESFEGEKQQIIHRLLLPDDYIKSY